VWYIRWYIRVRETCSQVLGDVPGDVPQGGVDVRYSKPRRIQIRGELSEHFYCRRYDTATKRRVFVSTGRTAQSAAYDQKRKWEKEDSTGKTGEANRLFREA